MSAIPELRLPARIHSVVDVDGSKLVALLKSLIARNDVIPQITVAHRYVLIEASRYDYHYRIEIRTHLGRYYAVAERGIERRIRVTMEGSVDLQALRELLPKLVDKLI